MNEFISEDFESHLGSKIDAAQNKFKKLLKEIKDVDLPFFDLPSGIKPKRIAALDGGGFSKDLVGVTIVPSKAAGAIFEQGKDPVWFEKSDIEILTIEEDPKNFGALLRDLLEVEVAQELANEKPDILFLDGSITNFAYKGFPQNLRYYLEVEKEIDMSFPGYRFYELFLKFIRSAYKLITYCIENDVLLIGVSKDSRANILVKHFFKGKKPTPALSDTTFVQIKTKGKTGFTKPIEFTPDIREVRKNIWRSAEVFQEEQLRSFYLSYFILNEGSQPIRIDSLLPQRNRLKEIHEALVTYHDGYGFITPAYLTHKRAHMDSDFGNRLINLVIEKVFEDSPEIYRAFLASQRRDIIQ
ncbi:MAG: DNA double-strand break repair nuclease NurA [Asgard group archaeon]|nr:DNA double-strand break repair nuclease NurA [Asgard group archaeon]